MAETWYCIFSPQYGLLFTAHTHRRGAIDQFVMHGTNRLWTGKQIMKKWCTDKRNGYRTVKIKVRSSSTKR